jgi:CRP-like cAMP-binding protein
MVSFDFLEKVDILKDLDDDQLTAILGCCHEVEYSRGDQLFAVSQDPGALYVIMEGEVDLTRGGEVDPATKRYFPLYATMTLGWSSVVPPRGSPLSAFCTSRKCKILKIERDCLVDLLDQNPDIGFPVMSRIVEIIGSRFHSLREEIIHKLGQDIMNQW